VGASSRDIRLTQAIVVAGTRPARPMTGMSTLAEWLADPAGGPALRAAFGAGPDGRPGGILASGELVRMLREVPLSTLAVFGAGITHEQVESLIAAVARG
jgi:beta-glucosidase